VQVRRNARLAELTTLGVGGPIDRLVEVSDAAELVAAVREADDAGRPLLVLGGGSNLIGPDDGWPGDVVAVRSRGVERDGGRLLVQAGEPWDHLVAHTVEQQLAGMEAMSGIPARPGRRRCRTSAPTARRSPRSSAPSGCGTGRSPPSTC
jgi:UDP-N-acetylmuramate dehydrogenase